MIKTTNKQKVIPVRVMGYQDAKEHIPRVPTYAIRIYDTSGESEKFYGKLCGKYLAINNYYFDGVHQKSTEGGLLSLTDEIAQKMLLDFILYRRQAEELLIHDWFENERSSATALAFNEIFMLGNSTEEIERRYPQYNKFVRRTLLENSHVINPNL